MGKSFFTLLLAGRRVNDWIRFVRRLKRRLSVYTWALKWFVSQRVAGKYMCTTKMVTMSLCQYIVMRAKALTLKAFARVYGE